MSNPVSGGFVLNDDANCRGADPTIFFPVGNTGSALVAIERAKQVCDGCPQRVECLSFALTNNEYGVWGGTSEEDRRALRRRARVAA